MNLKIVEGNQINTYCDVCQQLLREDFVTSKVIKRTLLHQGVSHLGNGRHKCKPCFKKGFKARWKYNLNSLGEEL